MKIYGTWFGDECEIHYHTTMNGAIDEANNWIDQCNEVDEDTKTDWRHQMFHRNAVKDEDDNYVITVDEYEVIED